MSKLELRRIDELNAHIISQPEYNERSMAIIQENFDKLSKHYNKISEPIKIKIKMEEGCDDLIPVKAHVGDAAYDLKSSEDFDISSSEIKVISNGFRMNLPKGYEAQVRSRSGLSIKGVVVKNSPGTIDENYTGIVSTILTYVPDTAFKDRVFTASDFFHVKRGDRIAQMVIAKIPDTEVEIVKELSETNRGDNGFGSSGVK